MCLIVLGRLGQLLTIHGLAALWLHLPRRPHLGGRVRCLRFDGVRGLHVALRLDALLWTDALLGLHVMLCFHMLTQLLLGRRLSVLFGVHVVLQVFREG